MRDRPVDRARSGRRGRPCRSPERSVGGHVGGPFAADQLVEDDAQAVEVAPAVGLVGPAGGGLGAHVLGRPQDRPFQGQVGFEVASTGQAEVGQPSPTRVVDQDVGRLQVAMKDPSAVGVIERQGQVADDPDESRRSTVDPGRGPSRASGRARAGRRSSIAPSSRPASWRPTMLGWSSLAAALASR